MLNLAAFTFSAGRLAKQYKIERKSTVVEAYGGRGFVVCGESAKNAIRSARIALLWNALERFDLVRLTQEPDDIGFDDLSEDMFDPRVNPSIPASRLKRDEKEYRDRIDRDGVWVLLGQFDAHGIDDCDDCEHEPEWKTCDSVGGFVGDDWEGSGYDRDIQAATIEAAINENPAACRSAFSHFGITMPFPDAPSDAEALASVCAC